MHTAALWRWGLAALTAMTNGEVARAENVVPTATEAQALYLQAFVNGLDKGLIVRVDRQGARFYIAADELTEIGIRIDALPLGADRRIALDAIPGTHYAYGEAEQRLDLRVPDALLQVERLGLREAPPPLAPAATGLVLNYAANLQSTRVDLVQRQAVRTLSPAMGAGFYSSQPLLSEQDFARSYDDVNRTFALASELRFFSPIGVFVNKGYTTLGNGLSKYTRQDSYWTYSDVETERTYTVGDFVSSSLPWSRALRMGGVSIAKNFQTRPDLITFPVPALGGSAVVPTSVDLYINGLRQFSALASGGPFVISTPPALTGAGNAQLVYRDELGRQISIEKALYMDVRLLAPGLTDYAVQIGFPRRSYGSRSFDYADQPAFNASLRHGMSDDLTLEGNAQWARDLRNAGLGGLFRLSHYGVLNAALAFSTGQGNGRQWSLGYQYSAPEFNLTLQGLRTQGAYQDLGSTEGIAVPPRQLHAALSLPITERQNLMLSYSRQDASLLGGSRVVSLGYSASWGSRVNAFANLFKDLDQARSVGLYAGLLIQLDNRISISGSASRYGDRSTAAVAASRSVDYDQGGFGWSVLADGGNQGYRHAFARLDYRGDYGDLSAQLESSAGTQTRYTNTALSAAGALVWMDGNLMAARVLHDAFGVISTDGVAELPVTRENRPMGRTDAQGHLVIPDLLPYQRNRLAIDTLGLPADMAADTDHQDVAPPSGTGVLVRFALQRYRGATVLLTDERGQPVPAGTPVELLGTQERARVGYDGAVFFPTLQARNTVEARWSGQRCRATIAFTEADTMKTIGPFVCTPIPPP